jgi:putative nucleotidyltransferase with HDIG domain
MSNPNALALLSNLKSKQQDSVRHSLNVCILSLLFGRYLGISIEQLNELGYAALLHDVGEIKIPQAILDKHHRSLTDDEKKIMEMHTQYGAEILRKNLEIPDVAAKVAHSHHERVNGKGYPRGLKGSEIDLFSKIVCIVDVYEIVTNNPGAKVQISCPKALKSIYSLCDSYFDRELVEDFIKCLGIYPVGSVVELSNSELAIVITVKPGKHLLPTIMVIRDSKGISRYPPQIINLDNFKDSEGVPKLFINKVIDPESVGIDLSDYMIREI